MKSKRCVLIQNNRNKNSEKPTSFLFFGGKDANEGIQMYTVREVLWQNFKKYAWGGSESVSGTSGDKTENGIFLYYKNKV